MSPCPVYYFLIKPAQLGELKNLVKFAKFRCQTLLLFSVKQKLVESTFLPVIDNGDVLYINFLSSLPSHAAEYGGTEQL